MSQNLNFLKIIGKVIYLIGVLLFFNFFFGLLFFRFLPWLISGLILLFIFSGVLAIGKNILFTNFAKTKRPKDSVYQKDQAYKEGDVIDVEAQVFENDGSQDN